MSHMLMRSWWILALRGAIALMFGILALAMPGVTLLSLLILFAAYALLAGAVAAVGAIGNRKSDADWWALLLLGVVSMAAGVLAALYPALTALVLVIVIGANALVTGVLELILSVRLRQSIRGEWLLVFSAITSILFGLLVLIYPGAGALALVWMIGMYAALTGSLYLALAYGAYRGRAPEQVAGTGSLRPEPERRVGDRRMTPAGHR